MHKIIYISCAALLLAGCNKAVEDKQISELTSEEATAICQSPEVLAQLQNNFKTSSQAFLEKQPLNYYPWIDRTRSDVASITDSAKRRADRVDVGYQYTADTFAKGLDTNKARLKIQDVKLSATGQDSLTCSATVDFTADELYGLDFNSPVDYNIKKDGKKFVTDKALALNQLNSKKGEPTAAQKEWRDKYEAQLTAKDDEARNVPDSAYKAVSQDDLYYIYFAQSPRQFSDDELMGFFSPKWNNTTDVFAKEDIKKEELPKIKEKISQYKDTKNIIAYSDFGLNTKNLAEKYTLKTPAGETAIQGGSAWVSASQSYDMDKKGYKYKAPFCDMTGGKDISSRGITFSIDEGIRGCILPVPDDKAREISAKFADINRQHNDIGTFVKSYIQITGVDGDSNTIHASLIRDHVLIIDPENDEVLLETDVK